MGVAVDTDGNLYIADCFNYLIRKVDTNGIITTFAGMRGPTGSSGDGGPATSAFLYYPFGITLDAQGNLYIAVPQSNNIRMVDTEGIMHTVAGTGQMGYSGDNGPARFARLNFPYDVTLDNDGNLYISDSNNGVIRKIGY